MKKKLNDYIQAVYEAILVLPTSKHNGFDIKWTINQLRELKQDLEKALESVKE